MRILAFIGVLAILVAIAGGVYFFGGFYSVAAATDKGSGPINWALVRVRRASITRHANDVPPATLDDQATIEAGARAFSARGCATCHGAPGVAWAKFSEAVEPDPPNLKNVVRYLSAAKMFWVIKNGIRMTAMPGIVTNGAHDDEIWSIVAFVRKIGTVSDADYKSWTATTQP